VKLLVIAAAVCGGILTLAGARAALPETEAVDAAAAWVLSLQTEDGGFPGFTEESAPSPTGDAVLALEAAGIQDLASLSNGGDTLGDYFLSAGVVLAADLATPGNAGAAGKLVLAALAADADPDLGVGMTGLLAATYDEATGQYGGGDLYDHVYVILALDGAGDSVEPAAIDYLLERQTQRGSWSFFGGTGPDDGDTNTTSVVLQALVRLGAGAEAIDAAVAYFDETQNADGGFPYASPSEFGTDSDVNSSALVVQALLAVGEDPEAGAWAEAGGTPVAYLLSEQNESGAFNYNAGFPGDNALATYQAIPALAGELLGGNKVDLFEGWNMVGWAGEPVDGDQAIAGTFDARVDGGPWEAVAWYSESTGWLATYREVPLGSLNTLQELLPGEDYWLFVSSEATLEYPLP
jgi:hypothetical protein